MLGVALTAAVLLAAASAQPCDTSAAVQCLQAAESAPDSHAYFLENCCGAASAIFEVCAHNEMATLLYSDFFTTQPFADQLMGHFMDCPGEASPRAAAARAG